jgi:hypothetical protein
MLFVLWSHCAHLRRFLGTEKVVGHDSDWLLAEVLGKVGQAVEIAENWNWV